MFNESYSDNAFNTNLYPLLGYDKPEQDSFSLTNKFIQSWSFDGLIPLQAKYVTVWNKDTGQFNVKPGDYIYVLDEASGAYETKPVISVTTDPSLNYFSVTGEPNSPATTSFTSNVFIEYLDERGLSKTKTIVTELDAQGFPSNQISVISENWNQKILGSSGWMISASGNAIFNNLAIRGQIDATSGNFSGNLSVNNGEMKIGSGVSSIKSYSVASFKILSNKVTLTIGTHTFAVGDIISVKNLDSLGAMAVAFPSNATITNVSGSGTQITYTASNTFSAGMKVQITGVNPTAYNLTSAEILSRNSTSFVVAGTTTSSYVSGGSATVTSVPTTAVDINGEYVITDITSTKISYALVASNFPETALSYGTVESIIANDGIFINDYNYWYDDGRFEVGNVDSGVTWNPDTSLLNVTGNITASQIRGSDVYANSAQLGGSEFGWVSGNGGIFSGTDQSTAYLQSGFNANPILNIEQELDGGLIKEYTLAVTGTLSAGPRSLFATFSNEIQNVKKGYQIYTGAGTSRFLVGIVDEVIETEPDSGYSKTVRLRSVPSRFIVNESFSIKYAKSTITTQFFAGFADGVKIAIESPEGTEYDISGIDYEVTAFNNKTVTYQIPPNWTNIYDKKPLLYTFKSAFLTSSSGEINNVKLDIQSIFAEKSTIDGVDFYDVKISVKASDIEVNGELLLDVGQNIFIANIPTNSEFFYPLINSYFPIIDIIENGSNYDVLLYADGYLSFSSPSQSDTFVTYSINKFNSLDNKITLTTTANHRFSVGQVVDLDYVSTPYLDDSWSLEPRVITEVTVDTFSFQYVFPNKQNIGVLATTTKARSLPTITRKSYDKDYSIWIGASNPTDAPFSIDTYGQNVKIKNLEVTGTVTGLYYDIIELDDFSGAFDGRKVTFKPTYNYKEVVIDNPLKLVLSVNGVLQSAFIKNREYVWQTGFLGFRGYTVDEYGQIKFSESPPPGSTINARVFPGPQKNKTSRIYPFKAVDIALG